MRDMVRAHRLLARHLGIDHVQLLVGSSIGGFQCLEWCISDPQFARNAAFIATAAQASPWQVAFNETQRMAIDCDSTFGSPSAQAGMTGMAVARAIALLSYRGGKAYNKTQADTSLAATCFDHRVQSYQHHQGEKLCRRFNAYSYYRLLQAFDSHDVAVDLRRLFCVPTTGLEPEVTAKTLDKLRAAGWTEGKNIFGDCLITPSTVRLSIGTEHIDDIIDDLSPRNTPWRA